MGLYTLKIIKNEYIFKEGFCELVIVGGEYSGKRFIIDIEDVEKCKSHTWHVQHTDVHNYCATKDGKSVLLLHRYLIEPPNNMVVDHINGNTYDNRKSNLRICTRQENSMNQAMRSDNTSGYKGVLWYHYNGVDKWQATIQVNKKKISLGYYEKLEDVIKVRKNAEERYFGEYIRG